MQPEPTLTSFRDTLREHKPMLRQRFAVSRIGIFGSFARGQATPESDLDVLVHLDRPIGLEFVTLADTLEDLLGTRVDLVSAPAIRANMRPFVEKELIYV